MSSLKTRFYTMDKRELMQTGYKFDTTLNKSCTDKIYIFIKGNLKDNEKAIYIEENTTYSERSKFKCVLKRKKIYNDCLGFYIHIYKGKKLYLHDKDFQTVSIKC